MENESPRSRRVGLYHQLREKFIEQRRPKVDPKVEPYSYIEFMNLADTIKDPKIVNYKQIYLKKKPVKLEKPVKLNGDSRCIEIFQPRLNGGKTREFNTEVISNPEFKKFVETHNKRLMDTFTKVEGMSTFKFKEEFIKFRGSNL